MSNSPFKFLDSYSKEDAAIFFGRDRETEELYQKVFESKVLLLYGVSGTGKSSLIDCGLGNKIADSDWLPISIRRGSGIVDSLWQKLNEPEQSGEVGSGQWAVGSRDAVKKFLKKLKSVYLDNFKPIYLIFDQFEELFIFGSREERGEFIELVRAIMDADIQCKMLFSIREEYLANITEFERKVPEIMRNRMRVEKMSRSNALEVISGPCKVHGIELEEGFEEALMNKLVPEGNEVELTYLQVYLDKIFKEATKTTLDARRSTLNETSSPEFESITFPLSILDQLGKVSDLLGSFLEDQIVELDDPESGLAILKSFVSVKGTKRQVTHEEVLESCKTLGSEVEDVTLKELINKFVDLRILRDKDENGRYELRHDSLAAKIYEKITLVEKEVMEVRMFIESAYSNFQSRKALLSEDDLKYIEPYEERLFLGKELSDFLEQSKYDIQAARRSFRKIIAISITGFVLIIAAAGFYYYQKSQIRTLEHLSLASTLQMEYSPEMSLLTARKAYYENTASSLSKKILLDAFYKKWNVQTEVQKMVFDFTPGSKPIVSISLSEDGQFVYGWTLDNALKIWDLRGKELCSFQVEGDSIQRLRLSEDNLLLGVLFADSTVSILSLSDSSSFSINVTPNDINNKYLFDFSGREEFSIAVANGKDVFLYKNNGEVFQVLSAHEDRINALDISPDKRFIASAASDSKVNVWYYNSNTKQYEIFNQIEGHTAPVRSCQFNKQSNYILTASDDRLRAVWSLYGERFMDFSWYQSMPGFGDEYNGYWNRMLGGKVADATFASDDKIVIMTMNWKDDNSDSLKHRCNIYMVHDNQSEFADQYVYGAEEIFWNHFDNTRPIRYDYLVPAPDTRTAAVVIEEKDNIDVVTNDHLPILSVKGTCPVYTSDSRYIISINGNKLQKHVLEPEDVIDLVWNKKIFGELKPDARDVVSY